MVGQCCQEISYNPIKILSVIVWKRLGCVLGIESTYLGLLELDDLETSLYYLGTKAKSENY
jgi:hypothetical protein